MRTKMRITALWLFMIMLVSATAFLPSAEAYYGAFGPYYTYLYSPFEYSPYYPAPPDIIPYRSSQALLTSLALLSLLPSSTSTYNPYSTPTTYPYTTYYPSTTSTPTYSYPSSSTSIGLATVLLLGGSTSTSTLLAASLI